MSYLLTSLEALKNELRMKFLLSSVASFTRSSVDCFEIPQGING